MRNKLLLIFGALIVAVGFTLAFLGVSIARKAVTEKVEIHLKDKAEDTAAIIDERIKGFFKILEEISRIPQIRDASLSYKEKSAILEKELEFHNFLEELYIVDKSGIQYRSDDTKDDYSKDTWFKEAIQEKYFSAEPYIDPTANNQIFISFAIPVYDDDKNLIGVLGSDVMAQQLSKDIADIVVGQTGYCYILGLKGNIIAHNDFELVYNLQNYQETAKTDKSFASLASFEKQAIENDKPSIGYYEYNQINKIASYAKMKTTGWTVIINAPIEEFMGTVDSLQFKMFSIGLSILFLSLIIVFFVARKMVLPINTVLDALKDIAQAEGDLTVRLPVTGNDEITDLSELFNQTISKIGLSIKGEIDALSDSAKTAEEKFNTIFDLSEQVKNMSQSLIDAMREQENGSKEVLIAIRDINLITNQVSEGSAEMLRGGENVAQEMHKLDGLTSIITGSMNEMAAGAIQIRNAVQDANEISQKNKHSIENLSKEVGKFKV